MNPFNASSNVNELGGKKKAEEHYNVEGTTSPCNSRKLHYPFSSYPQLDFFSDPQSDTMNSKPASVQVDLVTARREMLNNLFTEVNIINTIIIFLDITGRRPWCGRVGLKWLLSEQQQHYLAQLACHLLFNVPPPDARPVLFNGYGHIEETNFDEVLAAFLSVGVKECVKYVFTNNVSKIAVSSFIASHIVRGFMMIFS